MTISYILSGFAVGLLVGLTGVGGGSLMTPLLTLLFGINPSVAVGTDLAFAAITKSFGTLTHRIRGTTSWPVVKLLCLGAIPAAILSALALKFFGGLSKDSGQMIRYAIAASICLTIIALVFKGKMLAWINRHPEKQLHGKQLSTATVIAGAILGILVTISSIGAGAVGATIIVLLYPKLSSAEVAGTDIAYAVPLTTIAAIGHWWLGSLNWALLGALLIGSIPGITIGSFAARAVPDRLLRALLVITLAGVALKLVQ